MKVIVLEKHAEGGPAAIDERDWPEEWLASLEHANYMIVNGQEYEMLEGRLNLDRGALELLVVPVAPAAGEKRGRTEDTGMKQPEKQTGGNCAGPAKSSRKPMKVLSTSLGMALAAHLLAVPGVSAEGADAAAKPQPKLVEWSTDAVKSYYDPNVDWNLALPDDKKPDAARQEAAGGGAGAGGAGAAAAGGGGTNTVVVQQGGGGGFGWDDLLLYHLLFNNGGVYSTSAWSQSHSTVYANNHQPYQARSYTPDAFQNKPVAGSAVRPPQTAASSGSFATNRSQTSAGGDAAKSTAAKSTAASGGSKASPSLPAAPSTSTSSGSFSSSPKSTSTSPGSIGGRSSGFSSSSGS
jgi:hypothetical protein